MLYIRKETSRNNRWKIRYLTLEHHFVLEHNNKLYDTTGNVTNSYINSKYITESEFNSREKIRKGIKIFQ